jgi:hypothetical protein
MISLVIYKMKNMGTSARNKISNFGRAVSELAATRAAVDGDYLPPGVGKMVERMMLRREKTLSTMRFRQGTFKPRPEDEIEMRLPLARAKAAET